MQKYHPYASDPNLSGALASVLWELNLLTKHYHPVVSTTASSISMMNAANNRAVHTNLSPQQAFMQLSLEPEPFIPSNSMKTSANKRKKGSGCLPSTNSVSKLESTNTSDENHVKKKLAEHFSVLDDMVENERLRAEFYSTNRSLKLYEEYKKQKRKNR